MIFDHESKIILKSIENGAHVPLWQYHLFAPFLMNQISHQQYKDFVQVGLQALGKPLYPYTQQDVLDRWDAISLLSTLSSKMDNENLESFAILLFESLHFKAAPVRANAALAVLEIMHKIKSQSLLDLLLKRLLALVESDKSHFVRYYADLASSRLRRPGITSKFMFYQGENPLSGIDSARLFHRFIRLWCTGNIEFYQGDYQKQGKVVALSSFQKCKPEILNEFTLRKKIPLPLSYMQFLVDVANGGQLSRISQNLQLLHNDEWIDEDEPDTWQVPWVTLMPAAPRWVSIVENEEILPDELGTLRISDRFKNEGDANLAQRFKSLITLVENADADSTLNFDYFTGENLHNFSFSTKSMSRNALKFYLWINQPFAI